MIKFQIIFLLFAFQWSIFAKTYEVNGQHSFVNFELDYMKVSQVKGAFEKFQGSFDWDKDSGQLKDVVFEIFVDSINTRDPKRDNHLRRKDFFYASKFPVISFVANKVSYENGVPHKVSGELEVRGVKKQHTFDINWKGEFSDPVDKKKRSLFLSAKTVIDRKEFNIRWNKALDKGGWVVGEKVSVEIIIEANPTDARPAFSRFYIKKNKLLPGKLLAPAKSGINPKNIKPSETERVKKNTKAQSEVGEVTSTKIAKGGLSLILAFVIFCALCFVSFFLKKHLQIFLERRISRFWSDMISDFLLYSFLFGASYYLAPLMGYKRFF